MSVSPLIVKYEKTLARNPRSQVFAPLSGLYRKIGLMDKAREVLQNGIRYNPAYIPGYIELANYYIDLGEFQLAHATIRPLVNANRDNLKLQKLFVRCCSELEYKSEALDTLKYLLFLNPKDREIANRISELEKEEVVISTKPEGEQGIKFDVDSLDSQKIDDEDYGDWVEVSTSRKSQEHDIVETNWSIESLKPELDDNVPSKTKDEDPLVNHTLVEIFLEQGHIEKAKEVTEKILEIQPNDIATQKKLNDINDLIRLDTEPSSDFNTGSLMEVFDKKVAKFNDRDIDRVSDRLDLFLSALRDRGSEDQFL